MTVLENASRTFPLALLLALPACATSTDDSAALARAVYDYLDDVPGPVYYFPARADLDGDGVDEGIVHLVGPAICGSGGCPTLVYRFSAGDYRLVNAIGPSRLPVRVARSSSNGWRNLIVSVSGGGIQPGHDTLLKFDGAGYPPNPTVPPAEALEKLPGNRTVIDDFDDLSEGQLLKPGQ